jgi:dihydropteroate synthase
MADFAMAAETRTSLVGTHIHFITGRLAEPALRETVERLASEHRFHFTIDVLPITVAALMTPNWIARHAKIPKSANRVIIPGLCVGETLALTSLTSAPIEFGPGDLRELPEYLSGQPRDLSGYGAYDIEILAEINHAPRLATAEIERLARHYRESGADLIDLGCQPGEVWSGVGDCVKRLVDAGFRVSIDSLTPPEIAIATNAGAELVLSVNSTNVEAAPDWGAEVVVIPDDLADYRSMIPTIEKLDRAKVKFRLDPILEPIGFGFGESLLRYRETRRAFPNAEMMMGIGNLTELTDVDSAVVNTLLLALCQEWGIRSVLTTEVINWARSSVKECDLARRLMHFAVTHKTPPKRLEPNLIVARDAKLYPRSQRELDDLADKLKDPNYRIFAAEDRVHVVRAGLHLSETDPFILFDQLLQLDASRLDPSHAFYLGYEMAKAVVALTLGKEYRQDNALSFGHLTRPELSRHDRKKMQSITEVHSTDPSKDAGHA